MRDYEMVELKLSVAQDEGVATRGCAISTGEFHVERLMPGLYILGAPIGAYRVDLAVFTDKFDLSLLGFTTADDSALVVLHDRDLAVLSESHIEINQDRIQRREALPGWTFAEFSWGDRQAVDRALRALFPAYCPSQIPAGYEIEG